MLPHYRRFDGHLPGFHATVSVSSGEAGTRSLLSGKDRVKYLGEMLVIVPGIGKAYPADE